MIPTWRKNDLAALVYRHLNVTRDVVDEVVDEFCNCLVEIAERGEVIVLPNFGKLLPAGKHIKKKLQRHDGKVVDFEGLSIHYKFQESYHFRLKMRELAKQVEGADTK